MITTTEFINGLFEKSKILNDLNTTFLSELEFGELSLTQRLDLFYKNTRYHENILNSIAQIVKDLDKTSVLLSTEQREALAIIGDYDDYTQFKFNKVLQAMQETRFIPRNLTTCPECGNRIVGNNSHTAGCRRVPFQIGDKIIGYTINCRNKRSKNNESE